jgi:hypothetical protein
MAAQLSPNEMDVYESLSNDIIEQVRWSQWLEVSVCLVWMHAASRPVTTSRTEL